MQQILILFLKIFKLLIVATLFLPSLTLAQDSAPSPLPRPERNITNQTPPSSTIPINGTSNQILNLSAKISENGSIISKGVIWRVFNSEPSQNGEMEILAKSQDSIASIAIKPGNYIIHASYGLAQTSKTIRVDKKPKNELLVLNSGALKLNAAIVGDINIISSKITFDIFTTPPDQTEQVAIVKGAKPNTIINLNAGNYNVTSYFGSINATVSAELKVEPGQITQATLYHKAGEVSFKLVSEAGGRAIPDVDWVIKDDKDKILLTSMSAFPTAILSEGDYTVIAKRGQNVYNRNFSVKAGSTKEIEVLISVY
jgi:hypothetical protein